MENIPHQTFTVFWSFAQLVSLSLFREYACRSLRFSVESHVFRWVFTFGMALFGYDERHQQRYLHSKLLYIYFFLSFLTFSGKLYTHSFTSCSIIGLYFETFNFRLRCVAMRDRDSDRKTKHDQNGNETTKSDIHICRAKSGVMFGVYLNRFWSEMFGHLVLAVGVLCAVCVHNI